MRSRRTLKERPRIRIGSQKGSMPNIRQRCLSGGIFPSRPLNERAHRVPIRHVIPTIRRRRQDIRNRHRRRLPILRHHNLRLTDNAIQISQNDRPLVRLITRRCHNPSQRFGIIGGQIVPARRLIIERQHIKRQQIARRPRTIPKTNARLIRVIAHLPNQRLTSTLYHLIRAIAHLATNRTRNNSADTRSPSSVHIRE